MIMTADVIVFNAHPQCADLLFKRLKDISHSYSSLSATRPASAQKHKAMSEPLHLALMSAFNPVIFLMMMFTSHKEAMEDPRISLSIIAWTQRMSERVQAHVSVLKPSDTRLPNLQLLYLMTLARISITTMHMVQKSNPCSKVRYPPNLPLLMSDDISSCPVVRHKPLRKL